MPLTVMAGRLPVRVESLLREVTGVAVTVPKAARAEIMENFIVFVVA